MLTDAKILHKLRQVVKAYTALRFEPVLAPECEYAETAQRLGTDPQGLDWHPAPAGTSWGDDGITGWFRCRVSLPAVCANRKVWVRFKCPQETLFLRNGEPWGVFDGNHPYACLTTQGQAGTEYALAFEAYSGHNMPVTGPDDAGITVLPGSRTFDGVELALERNDVSGFVFDLMTLLGLVDCLDDNSLRKAQVIAGLAEVYAA
ncbi:hypothetical protein LLH03_03540, partial [bacterium]|nr:hypothetical protein [bacterium]